MMLQLRQLTAHLFLVQDDIKATISKEDLEGIKKSLTIEAQSDNTQIEMLGELWNLVVDKRNLHRGRSNPSPVVSGRLGLVAGPWISRGS